MKNSGLNWRIIIFVALAVLATCILLPSDLLAASEDTPLAPITPVPGTPNLSDLVTQLADQDASIRLSATCQLSALRSSADNAISALIQATGDPDPQVRCASVYALGRLPQVSDLIISTLVGRLGDDIGRVRYNAAKALGNIGSRAQTALPSLLERLARDDDENVRCAAAEAIVMIGPDLDALPTLTGALTDDNMCLRRYAEIALRQPGAAPLVCTDESGAQEWYLRSPLIKQYAPSVWAGQGVDDQLSQVCPQEADPGLSGDLSLDTCTDGCHCSPSGQPRSLHKIYVALVTMFRR